MVSISKDTAYYVRINNDYELELLCSYLNTKFPRKFRWASDSDIIVKEITKDYIKNICNYKRQTLRLDRDYCFTYASMIHYNIGDIDSSGNKVINVYDLEGIGDLANSAREKQDILSWIK